MMENDSSYLGIDIGKTSIKMVELIKRKNVLRLFTYGFTEYKNSLSYDSKDNQYIAHIINQLREEAGSKSRKVVGALPSFSVFSSIINISNVNKKDLSSAILWEAKKVIPLPLEEVSLDWQIIDEQKDKKNNFQIFLTGAPKALVQKYMDIFKLANLSLISLETETFSLIRSLLSNDKSTVMIVEIGGSTTDISIVKNSIPHLSRSIDFGGINITKALSSNLNVGLERAEQFKFDLGINSTEESEIIPKTIIESLDPVVNEIKHMFNLFQTGENNKIEKIILSGGASMIPGFNQYLNKILNINVIIGNPWSRVSCPKDLMPLLSEIGAKMSVSIGLSMRGFD
jgi:type IV pilus assembly protein PilM